MKKVALSLLAFAVVGVGAFADAPKWDPKVTTELKGDASVTVGTDLDYNVIALSNAANVKLVIDLVSKGDRTTASDSDVWGEIKVTTDGDPFALKYDDASDKDFGTITNGRIAGDKFFNLKVDHAQINIGKNAYVSVTSKDTNIGYAAYPELPFRAALRSGAYGAFGMNTFGDDKTGTPEVQNTVQAKIGAYGQNTKGGAEFGFTVPDVAKFVVDAGTTDAWVGDKLNTNKTNIALKGSVSVLAVPNLTLEAGADYTSKEKQDAAVGGKVGYKVAITDTIYVKPLVGATLVKVANDGDYLPVIVGGVLLGTGAKAATFDNYGLKLDKDWGGFPGVAVSAISTNKKLAKTNQAAVLSDKDSIWLSVAANSGTLVADTALVAAYEIMDLNAKDGKLFTVVTVGASTKTKLDAITVAPKGTINYQNNAAVDNSTQTYVKGTVDFTDVIPFVTFTANYESNDLNGNDKLTKDKKVGKFEFTTKVSF